MPGCVGVGCVSMPGVCCACVGCASMPALLVCVCRGVCLPVSMPGPRGCRCPVGVCADAGSPHGWARCARVVSALGGWRYIRGVFVLLASCIDTGLGLGVALRWRVCFTWFIARQELPRKVSRYACSL